MLTRTMDSNGKIDKVSSFKIFVKNLSHETSSEELKTVFETFGRVIECHLFKNTYAFVHMEDETSGRNAVLMLNAKIVNGKCIGVEESKQKDGPSVPSTRLMVRNVPLSVAAQDLRKLFSKYGVILSVEINNEQGVVTIEAIADIRSAINEINGYEMDGQKLVVEPIINSAISYSPKPRPTPTASPNFYRPSRPYMPLRVRPPPPPMGFFHGHGRMLRGPSPYNMHNPEGRVLRDPFGPGPPERMQHQPRFGFRPRNSRPQFRPHLVKRHLPEPEAGEQFPVPGMIALDSFIPPKKYFSNQTRRPKKKKKTEPRPQPPIPEQIQRPVPDFSSYYTSPPDGSFMLTPFPPPLNPDADFSEDTCI